MQRMVASAATAIALLALVVLAHMNPLLSCRMQFTVL
jgi:hypothetical protein